MAEIIHLLIPTQTAQPSRLLIYDASHENLFFDQFKVSCVFLKFTENYDTGVGYIVTPIFWN